MICHQNNFLKNDFIMLFIRNNKNLHTEYGGTIHCFTGRANSAGLWPVKNNKLLNTKIQSQQIHLIKFLKNQEI